MTLKQNILKFSIYMLLTLGVCLIVYADVRWPIEYEHQKFTEASYTEYAQELILVGIVGVFLLAGVRSFPRRSFGILLAGVFCMMFIRELDAMFDNVWHGFWKVPCLVAAIGFGSVAYRYRGNFISDVREFMNLPASGIFLCGLLTVLVFSRLFGSNYLWEPLMGEEYIRCAKNMAEEGLELLGYLFTGIGAVEYYVYLHIRFGYARPVVTAAVTRTISRRHVRQAPVVAGD